MCNLYSIRTSRAALARRFMLSDNRMAAFDPLPAIFPGHMAPIIKQSADGERELVMRSWGFVLLRDGYAPKRVTNTRDDKVQTKFWKDSFENRRCLVPATAFCEPDEGKPAKCVKQHSTWTPRIASRGNVTGGSPGGSVLMEWRGCWRAGGRA